MPTFDVADMECEACARAITNAVRGVDPAAVVAIDLTARQVRIDNATVAPERLAAALREAGFTVAA